MSEKIIQKLINGTYVDAYNKMAHVPVKSVYIDVGLAKNAKNLLLECGLSGRALVVSDKNTHSVLGKIIESALDLASSQAGEGNKSLVFENGVKAELVNVEKIKNAATSVDCVVAVGSGTINDLCKYASFLMKKPYVVFGTALSMNGYGSANASITISGHKKTLKAHLPQGIYLDLDVLAKSPVRLIRSGLGDSLCRSTAQADWLLSHLLLGTVYTDLPFQLLGGIEESLFTNSADLVKGDIEIIRLLAYTLILSGFGMYLAGGSYPASQGEHMIAHTMEMLYGDALPYSYHGEQIGVTTLTMARLQEGRLGNSAPQLSALPPEVGEVRGELVALLGEEVTSECLLAYQAKQFSQEKLRQINANIADNWNDITKQIQKVMLPYDILYNTLKNAGCPLKPEDIGWQNEQYKEAARLARFTRDRFTFLDLG